MSSTCVGVRISEVVEEGQVHYIPVPEHVPSSPHSTRIIDLDGKRKSAYSLVPRKCFEVVSPVTIRCRQKSIEDPGFGAAIHREDSGSRTRSRRDRRAALVLAVEKR